jgi:hypothetical protein
LYYITGAAVHGPERRCSIRLSSISAEARTLGKISRSFDSLALSMSAADLAALTQPTAEAWITLVRRTSLLVQHAHALRGIVVLGAQEREALDFFEAIVRENADLLVSAALTATPIGTS